MQSDIIPTLSHIKSYFLSEQSKTTQCDHAQVAVREFKHDK